MRKSSLMEDKKGSEMTIGTLVVIVLAVIVLVVLIMGFSLGWKNLWAKINPFIGGSSGGGNNVDSIKQACDILCQSGSTGSGGNVISPSSKVEYCKNIQTVVYGGGKANDKKTCNELSKMNIGIKPCDIVC
jgi:hypothetical protein